MRPKDVDGVEGRPAETSRAILAVASAGGHWMQLMRLRPAFGNCRVVYVSTLTGLTVSDSEVLTVRDASRTQKISVIFLALQLFSIVARLRPAAIITTGAAPGILALRIGKLFGARTVWIDSIANVEELSLSGLLARRHADLWLTQWPHLIGRYEGLQYRGSVL